MRNAEPHIADSTDVDPVCAEAVAIAENLLAAARSAQTGAERTQALRFARMMCDRRGQAFTLALVDECFRSANPTVQARRFRRLIGETGIPAYLSGFEHLLIAIAAVASRIFPRLVMPAVEHRMRRESSRFILRGETAALHDQVERRRQSGFRLNLNHLGEAVLGEGEATRRLDAILAHLDEPAIDTISVKISAIFSQINLVAWDATLAAIKNRLRPLYRAANARGKFVNLDMEEFRDLELTATAFRDLLDEPEFHGMSAGIVLQAYLPDSFAWQKLLVDWARSRVSSGAAPIRMRIVKGANLAMERVEAELHGWHSAPYDSKAETDANFRRMLEFACLRENASVVQLGVGSHNLFDVGLALALREKNDSREFVGIEMLEGMANQQARAVRDSAGGVLLYTPTVKSEDFLSAFAYLVRRLDENSTTGNFLRDLFTLDVDGDNWRAQRDRFVAGWNSRNSVSTISRRRKPAVTPESCDQFANAPDSDWTQPAVRGALSGALRSWTDPRPPELSDLDTMLEIAKRAGAAWSTRSDRVNIFERAAVQMTADRFNAIACMNAEGRKAVPEADAEVSEAIDFVRYYARTGCPSREIEASPLGVVVVAPPWNFPYAIPCGGVIAALAAGNAVILKPAPEAVRTAWLLVRQLWSAGIPREVLQFFPGPDGEPGKSLIADTRVNAVVLTGSIETARLFQRLRPSLQLLAETSGKNALVVTAQADRELAIKDLVRSAFGHSGQKCSAASLGILEAEVYDDPVFRRQLRDAAASLHVGPAVDPRSVVTPLVQQPGGALQRALTSLDDGEEWLLEPKQISDDPSAWSPGIKIGVRPGSWFHRTECFGPVLGLMRASSVDEAIAWQNATDFGLTAGIHTLDSNEAAMWMNRVEAGNLYVNRHITGAVVQRQPFGGWKSSCVGPGAKAGGPNYVLNLCHLEDAAAIDPSTVESNYRAAWSDHFSVGHDPSQLAAESNIFRYRPCRGVILRLEDHDETSLERANLASKLTGTPFVCSIRTEEPDDAFTGRLPDLAGSAIRLRTISVPADAILTAAHSSGLNWINAPISASGRIELRHWLLEQSISITRHRYGLIRQDD